MRSASLTAPPARLTPRLVLDAWRGITRRDVRNTFLLGCALFVLLIGTGLALFGGLAALVLIAIASQIRAFTILLAFVIADRVTGRDPERIGAYAVAVVVGASAASVLAVTFVNATIPLVLDEQFDRLTVFGHLYFLLDLLLIAGATVWIILGRRRAGSARARMQRAQLDRIVAERRSIESDLQAMQARVEPQFLFNTLAQVRALYREDSARGERMLDALIAYLRAAMPKMRDTSSTLGQEIELVRAYLGIVRLGLGERLAFEIESSPALADARMPPMMLLPLVDHAIAHGITASRANGAIRIHAAVDGCKVCLEIDDSGAGLLPGAEGEGVAAIRQRLSALYGGAAELALRRGDGDTTTAVLQFPLEGAGPLAAGA
jgi:hypothetical protein